MSKHTNELPIDILQKYCDEREIVFFFGRIDYANLSGVISQDKPHLFLLVQNFNPTIGKFGIEYYTCEVQLLLARLGDIGATHRDKFRTNIRGLIEVSNSMCTHLINCENWRPTKWQSTSVINKLDDILDGLSITATLRGHIQA